MNNFIFIVGGARSGKSDYAVGLAKGLGEEVFFIATAVAFDEEMRQRIKLHKKSRPRGWKTIEEQKDISLALSLVKGKNKVVLIDCMGLFVFNLMAEGLDAGKIESKIKNLVNTISESGHIVILVSNDVGSGIVPENLLARKFRDLLGRANQIAAKKADKVIFMQCGIPVIVKDVRGQRTEDRRQYPKN
ncbi:MAG: bifunctional adenosylcobinamide kinase/adenosylcobinamide-phosphate guanylyltransferase [Candidatus Omnitrophota bacterium]